MYVFSCKIYKNFAQTDAVALRVRERERERECAYTIIKLG